MVAMGPLSGRYHILRRGIKPSASHEHLFFARKWLAAPGSVGSVVPSSRYLTRAMLAAADVTSCNVIAEFGPGTGVMTNEIMRRMPAAARLLIFEIDQQFATRLRQRVVDPRVAVFNESADQLRQRLAEQQLDHVDCIISGIPFGALSPADAQPILEAAHNALRPGGRFVAFQYTPFRLSLFRSYFSSLKIAHLVVRNLPPSLVVVGIR